MRCIRFNSRSAVQTSDSNVPYLCLRYRRQRRFRGSPSAEKKTRCAGVVAGHAAAAPRTPGRRDGHGRRVRICRKGRSALRASRRLRRGKKRRKMALVRTWAPPRRRFNGDGTCETTTAKRRKKREERAGLNCGNWQAHSSFFPSARVLVHVSALLVGAGRFQLRALCVEHCPQTQACAMRARIKLCLSNYSMWPHPAQRSAAGWLICVATSNDNMCKLQNCCAPTRPSPGATMQAKTTQTVVQPFFNLSSIKPQME